MCGLPPFSNARLFDETVLNHNILWSVKKKINIWGICSYFLGLARKSPKGEDGIGRLWPMTVKHVALARGRRRTDREVNEGERIDRKAKGE